MSKKKTKRKRSGSKATPKHPSDIADLATVAKSRLRSVENPSPDLNSRLGSKLVYGGDGYLIAELTKGSCQHLGTLFLTS